VEGSRPILAEALSALHSEQGAPAAGQWFGDVAANPGAGAQLGGVGIGPGGNTDGRGSVDNDVGGAAGLDDRGIVTAIALKPSLEVRFGGQKVGLFAIAFDVSQNQVVGEVAGSATRARSGRYGRR